MYTSIELCYFNNHLNDNFYDNHKDKIRCLMSADEFELFNIMADGFP